MVQMLEAKDFKKLVKKYMGTVFEAEGFKYSKDSSDMRWIKKADDGKTYIAIGFEIDIRIIDNKLYTFTLYVDPYDIYDIRAYRHSGWPPKTIMKRLGIKPRFLDRHFWYSNYNAWIAFPSKNLDNPEAWEEYAQYLINDLYKKIPKGIIWTNKTHRHGLDEVKEVVIKLPFGANENKNTKKK